MSALKGRHVLSVSQFSRELVDHLFDVTRQTESYIRHSSEADTVLRGKTVACVFYQPSTRTFASFLSAAQSLGASTIPIQGVDYSSVAKGESLEDTVRTLGCYADAIVLRHPDVGASERASRFAGVPVINAGDGTGEHPTQALLDLYTIHRRLGRIGGLRVTLMGDVLRSRTVHSLARLLSMYEGVHLSFVAPPSLQLDNHLAIDLAKVSCSFSLHERLDEVVRETDVLYVTRVQKEYGGPYEQVVVDRDYKVGPDDVAPMPKGSIMMHPFPRVGELSTELDSDPRAAYFDQIRNGKFVRAALLAAVLGKA